MAIDSTVRLNAASDQSENEKQQTGAYSRRDDGAEHSPAQRKS